MHSLEGSPAISMSFYNVSPQGKSGATVITVGPIRWRCLLLHAYKKARRYCCRLLLWENWPPQHRRRNQFLDRNETTTVFQWADSLMKARAVSGSWGPHARMIRHMYPSILGRSTVIYFYACIYKSINLCFILLDFCFSCSLDIRCIPTCQFESKFLSNVWLMLVTWPLNLHLQLEIHGNSFK